MRTTIPIVPTLPILAEIVLVSQEVVLATTKLKNGQQRSDSAKDSLFESAKHLGERRSENDRLRLVLKCYTAKRRRSCEVMRASSEDQALNGVLRAVRVHLVAREAVQQAVLALVLLHVPEPALSASMKLHLR